MREHDSLHVLLIERNPAQAAQTTELLRSGRETGLVLTHAESLADAQPVLAGGAVSAILLGHGEHFALLDGVRVSAPSVPVVVLAPRYESTEATLALQAGAQDYLSAAQVTGASLVRALVHAVERKRAESGLAQRALQDPLTGLPNRNLFIDRVGVALDRARRSGGTTAVLFLDVDGFKAINDSLGHAAGDEVLTVLAARLQSSLRPMDTVARFGGDEFTFLFEGLSSAEEAAAIAERVRATASHPVNLDGQARRLHVSIGVATTADPTITPESLISKADFAMYESKRSAVHADTAGPHLRTPPPVVPETGSPATVGDEPAQDDGPHLHIAAEELRAALGRGQLGVAYQPVYGLNGSSEVIGFEALARWNHPSLGEIPAAEFIPMAEEVGVAVAIGQFVLGQALALLSHLRELRSELIVSVNLCPDQLADGELTAALAAVEAARVQPSAICVEIPERAVSENPERARRAARVLRAAGIRVAVDDYGTGDVSLSSLRTLGADELKIHESFVRELGREPHSGVVRAVVELGHALGMTVVAEGVETDSQLGELRSLGCDLAQGYLLSRPVGAEQLEELLLSSR